MRYPVLTRGRTEALVRSLASGDPAPNWALERQWAGRGADEDLTVLEREIASMQSEFGDREQSDGMTSAEAFEGRFAGRVHRALLDVSIEALDDPGFWRYLSLVHFWWFIEKREESAIGRGNALIYVNGGTECVPFRMFLRGQAIRDGDDYQLAAALPRSADFWRSHVLRVRTGTAPALARSLARLQLETGMTSAQVRPLARQINRLWSNVVLHTWTEAECDRVLRELYDTAAEARSEARGGIASEA